ncbi:hypothetical protein GUJ93_ZPchr0002g23156 [Zizania palustris]|uniref:Formin-like protein n=1 Tax=Zizania palustris TaxID=103762 RepID=A0A8J5RWR6_ZIZPA|nr:hypothetical protein GUJ93_ZPchr0002g23156 [Zizania palustris]
MGSAGFLLLLVAASALVVEPSRGGRGGEEENLRQFLDGQRRHRLSSAPPSSSLVVSGDLVDRIWSVCLQYIVGPEATLGFGRLLAWDELSSHSTEDEVKTMLFMEIIALLPPEKSSMTRDFWRSSFHGPAFAPSMPSGGEVQLPLSVTDAPPLTPSNPLNMESPNPHHHSKPAQKHWGVPPLVSSSEKHHDYMETVLIAVLPTAVFSFLAAFLVFYCCGCNKNKVSVGEQRDDHPLLHLQLSNLPGSSSDVCVPASQLNKDTHGLSPAEPSRSEESSASELAIESSESGVNAPRTKLRPLYWDKVLANPDQSMAWHDIKFGSFHVNEEIIEELFGYGAGNRNNGKDKEIAIADPSPQHVSLLDVKKSCNLAVVFKAMNVRAEDIHDALIEGNELPRLLLETMLRMKPTDDEEQKLRLYNGDCSQLGLAEQVMKALIDIPFAFKRIRSLLFMSSLQEDALSLRESFLQLEAACGELKHRLFLKLLEAVLKTGNRLNDGTFRGGANAFKLDTLLKLSDVKGADGKTTLLHFVVQEIIRSEGVREARLAMESGRSSPPPSASDDSSNESLLEDGNYYSNLGLKIVGLSSEMDSVKRVAALDSVALSTSVAGLRVELLEAKEFLNSDMAALEEGSGFQLLLQSFIGHAETETNFLLKEDARLRSLVKRTIRYFHGNDEKDDGFRLFVIVRDFLVMLDKACKEVGISQKKAIKKYQSNGNCNPSSEPNPQQHQFPAVLDHHLDSSDSND